MKEVVNVGKWQGVVHMRNIQKLANLKTNRFYKFAPSYLTCQKT